MICNYCNSEMRLDYVDNFKGNQDNYWVCDKCATVAFEKIRYGKVTEIHYNISGTAINVVKASKASKVKFCYDEDGDLVIWDEQKENSRRCFPSVVVDAKIVSLEMSRERLKCNSRKDICFTEACKAITNTILREEIFEKVINKKVKIRENIYETEVIIKQAGPKHFHVIINFIQIYRSKSSLLDWLVKTYLTTK